MSNARRRDRPNFIATVAFVGFALYIVMPIYWLVVNSTKSTPDLFSTFGFWFSDSPQFWENVIEVLTKKDGIFVRWLANTILYSTASALAATVLAFLAGYAFAKWQFRFKDALFWVVLAAVMIPGAALAVPTFQMLGVMGLINTPWAIILPSMISPFGLYLLRVYIDSSVPDELLDAARIDGAGEWRIVRSVVAPIASPGLATVFLLTFVATWNNYLLPLLVLSETALQPVTLGLTNWNRQSLFPTTGSEVLFNLVVTGSLLSILPLIALFVGLQRYLRSGLTLGAIK